MITTVIIILAALGVLYWFMRRRGPVREASRANVAQREESIRSNSGNASLSLPVREASGNASLSRPSVSGRVSSGIGENMTGIAESQPLKRTPQSLLNAIPDKMPDSEILGHRTVAEIMNDPTGKRRHLKENIENHVDNDVNWNSFGAMGSLRGNNSLDGFEELLDFSPDPDAIGPRNKNEKSLESSGLKIDGGFYATYFDDKGRYLKNALAPNNKALENAPRDLNNNVAPVYIWGADPDLGGIAEEEEEEEEEG